MSDKKLLELAAKAAGIDLKYLPPGYWDGNRNHKWNPLEDDGDALRLAVKLGIEIVPDIEEREAITVFSVIRTNRLGLNAFEDFGDDEMAATRRSIVRAAAEIGKEEEAIPADIVEAARTVEKWFAENNIKVWKLGGIQSRN